ncbi:MAG: hypothetical protein GY810_15215 [Aureispira sp.]|nr:hypothetical protein [Aureispira sp.]
MKKWINIFSTVVIVMIANTILLAQSAWIQSEAKKRDKTDLTHTLLDFDSTGYFVLRFDKKFGYAELEKYSQKLEASQTYQVTKERRKYRGVINIEGKMYLVFFRYKVNKDKQIYDKVSLYASRINSETMELEGQDSIELIAPFKMESNYYRGNFTVSPDKSKILVYDYEEAGDIEGVSGLTNKITLRVFDTSLKQLWKRTVDMSPTGTAKRMVAIKQLRMNSKGEVAILTDVFRKDRTYLTRKVTADPTLFFVGKEANNFARFTPSLGEYFYNQMGFSFDEEGNVSWFGFYSKSRYYYQGGLFFIKINAERTKVLVKKQHAFGEDLLKEILGRKKVKPTAEIRSYKKVHWQITKDGGLVITAEQQPPGNISFKSHGVLVVRFDAKGEIVWARHVYKYGEQPKKQRPFLSHYMVMYQYEVYLLFNRGIYADGYATVVRIDKEGDIKERKLQRYNTQQELLCPKLAYSVGKGNIFVCLQDRYFNYYRFGKINLPELFKPKKAK